MAGSLNHVQIIGYLGRDPEVRYTPDGIAVANVSVATTDSWTDKASGEKRERTEWHRCVLWRKLGELAGQYLSKGSRVYMDGKLETRDWQDKDGNKRYTTEINVLNMIFLGGDRGGSGQGAGAPPQGRPQSQQTGGGYYEEGPPAASTPDMMDDDIPF